MAHLVVFKFVSDLIMPVNVHFTYCEMFSYLIDYIQVVNSQFPLISAFFWLILAHFWLIFGFFFVFKFVSDMSMPANAHFTYCEMFSHLIDLYSSCKFAIAAHFGHF